MNNDLVKTIFDLKDDTLVATNEYKRRGLLIEDEEELNMRMLICSECKCFEKSSTICNLCGCGMNLKVRIKGSQCPIGKW